MSTISHEELRKAAECVNQSKMLIVNLFGVPSAGKSTGAAYIFSQLKMRGINAELVTEFTKDKVWEESGEAFKNQAYIFGEQYFKITRLHGKVDVVITDSPLLLSAFYNKSDVLGENFNTLVSKVAKSYDSLNILLYRDKPYNPNGRLQTEDESDQMIQPMKMMLTGYEIPHYTMKGNQEDYNVIVDMILDKMNSIEECTKVWYEARDGFKEIVYED